jgi:hypothetical protein
MWIADRGGGGAGVQISNFEFFKIGRTVEFIDGIRLVGQF